MNLTEKFIFKHSDVLPAESPFLSALKFSLDNVTRKNSKDRLSIPWVGEVSSRVRRLSIQLFPERLLEKNVHATIPKGNMGHDQYSVPDTVAVETTFVALL